jgi:uncharacterized membrane protein
VAGRLWQVDAARGAGLAAMAGYHIVYDLELFGLVPPGTAVTGVWVWLARATAATFLALAGVSLWLAHGGRVVWPRFWRRLGMVAGAAAAVSAVTAAAIPDAWVFFGILHAIAFGSVAGLAVLRLPWGAVAALAAAVLAADRTLALPAFDLPGLQWLGLGTLPPRSVDFVPVFPWFAAVLAGIAAARAAAAAGLWQRLQRAGPPGPPGRALAWAGRHSLAIYLLHQPVLIAAIAGWVALAR